MKIDESLLSSVQYVKNVGPHRARAFSRMGVRTIFDLLRYFPVWHIHKSLITDIALSKEGEKGFFTGKIIAVDEIKKPGRNVMKVIVDDGTAFFTWIWYNRPYLRGEFKEGRILIVNDIVENTKWGRQIIGSSGSYEFLTEEEQGFLKCGNVLPVYHSTRMLSQEALRNIFRFVVPKFSLICPDIIPAEILKEYKLIHYSEALRIMHLPVSLEEIEKARKRIVFEEIFLLQLFFNIRKKALQQKIKGRNYNTEGSLVGKFKEKLPFKLTNAQETVIKEIAEDLISEKPMNRLLQGDVGSGKTIVAVFSLLMAIDSGYQGVIMAPTEILAEQHYSTFKKFLDFLPVHICCLTGSTKSKDKKELLQKMQSGDAHIIIGTHALLEEEIKFKNLGLVIIDERHKFGVLQRAKLGCKGFFPDSLMMTATPFPRALVLTLYGDTDISILGEMPPGRKPIETKWVFEYRRQELYEFIRNKVKLGAQVYMVYPAVEESENSNLKAATKMAEHLQIDIFPEYNIGLIHGRMSGKDKENIMHDFKSNKINILISTTVIEVGIDVSNASIIVIEHAERFGLAQLHQLRGRVGRGKEKSYCVLMTGWRVSSVAKERMKIMQATNDGFKIAEMDLKLRGPGELLGIKQHGSLDFKFVNIMKDIDILEIARRESSDILTKDPLLTSEENKLLKDCFMEYFKKELEYASIS